MGLSEQHILATISDPIRRAEVAAQLAGGVTIKGKPSPSSAVATKAVKPARSTEPNKTELRFEREYLEEMKRSGAIREYRFEAVKLRLADRLTYSPDWMIVFADGRVEFVEVKGAYIYEDGAMKLKMVAEKYPEFRFWKAQWIRHEGWTITPVPPNREQWSYRGAK